MKWGLRPTPGGYDFYLPVSCTVSQTCYLEQKYDSSLWFLRRPFPGSSGDPRRWRVPRCLPFRILKGPPSREATKPHSVPLVLNKPNKFANKRQKKEPEECALPGPLLHPLYSLHTCRLNCLFVCLSPQQAPQFASLLLSFKMTEKHSAERSLPKRGFCPQKQSCGSEVNLTFSQVRLLPLPHLPPPPHTPKSRL